MKRALHVRILRIGIPEMKPLLFLALIAKHSIALDYKRDILSIFEKKCFDCHNAESKKLKGGLRLDDEEHFYNRFVKK